ncbi:hypothetical protein [Mycolicibacterium wolinskyi]|uniref:hypothetical protein n=1 Tax=Mycolicibacterium wolinskyi TaxID=59750 RepID=UPI003917819A
MKSTIKRVTVGAAFGGALFLSAGMGIANAQPNDGQVDLALGTAGVLEDVPIGTAAQIAAGVCDGEVAQVTTVAQNVDASGTQQNVCNNNVGAVEFKQNEGAPAEGAAEQPEGAAEGSEGSGTAEETGSAPAPAEEGSGEGS